MSVMRYLLAATLARGADAGAAVGFVLLADATPHLGYPALIGSLLVACLTAPHLFGPVLARRLDRARDGRQLIALVCGLYGVLVAAATLSLGRVPVAVVAVLAAAAGTCGPLLTGGDHDRHRRPACRHVPVTPLRRRPRVTPSPNPTWSTASSSGWPTRPSPVVPWWSP